MLLSYEADASSGDESPWWRTAAVDSPHGVLVSVETAGVECRQATPRATEVLFYASHRKEAHISPPTPPNSSPFFQDAFNRSDCELNLQVSALILSSDLYHFYPPSESTPPYSPKDEACEAIFLPGLQIPESEIINEPPARKRKTANEAFDEANERRKKARRKGGEGVAAAAASKVDKQMPSLQHRRSGSAGQTVPLQTRALSRSPSIASSRPTTANRPSTLSNVKNSASLSKESTIEQNNKDIISRIVMTGMRLHGLSKTRTRNTQNSHIVPSPAVDDSAECTEGQRQSEDEYKLIYHQVLKATCFAFRDTIRRDNLQQFSSNVRDVIDQLLVILCTNPLETGLGQSDDKLTPGGRKAFAIGTT